MLRSIWRCGCGLSGANAFFTLRGVLISRRAERDPLWKREARERWRRPFTFALLGVYTAILAALTRVFYGNLVPQGEIEFSRFGLGLGAPLFWKFVAFQIAGWVPLGLFLAAPAIALERQRGALVEYVLAGLTSQQIVRAKWNSIASFALVLVVAPLPVAALCFSLGGVSPLDFVAANALCVAVALSSCAWGMSLSANHKTVSAAFVAATGASLQLGLLACPLLFLAPSLPPLALLVFAFLLAFLPRAFLRNIEHEVGWLALRLEIDAPQTPDYADLSPAMALRLEPQLIEFAASEGFKGTPMRADEMAGWMNAAQVERGRITPPPSRFDEQLEEFVAANALAKREVQTQLRSWRRAGVLGEPPPLFSLPVSVFAGATLALLGAFLPAIAPLFHFGMWVCVVAAMVQVALLAANGFVRERQGNMIAQLQLSVLSPGEIVGAKVVSPLLLAARFWFYPLLILFVASLPNGLVRMVLEILVMLALLVLASTVGNVWSLVGRHVALVAGATLGTLVVLLLVLPMVFGPLLLRAPEVLELWWLSPLRTLGGMRPFSPDAMARLVVCVALFCGLCFAASLRLWKRARDG